MRRRRCAPGRGRRRRLVVGAHREVKPLAGEASTEYTARGVVGKQGEVGALFLREVLAEAGWMTMTAPLSPLATSLQIAGERLKGNLLRLEDVNEPLSGVRYALRGNSNGACARALKTEEMRG